MLAESEVHTIRHGYYTERWRSGNERLHKPKTGQKNGTNKVTQDIENKITGQNDKPLSKKYSLK